MKKAIKSFAIILVAIVGISMIMSGISFLTEKDKVDTTTNSPTSKQTSDSKIITIDGNNYDAGVRVNLINVWSNYKPKTFSHHLSHGEKVTLVSSAGEWVKIKDSIGREGYVSYSFIKEYK